MKGFEPKITAFACSRCTDNPKADVEGAKVDVVVIDCSGSLETSAVINAFRNGADGVLLAACRLGDCANRDGNYNAVRRAATAKSLLADLGVEGARLETCFMTMSGLEEFADAVARFAERIRNIGPSPLG